MNVYIVENTDPFNKSCGGIPTYIKNVAYYLKKRNVHTYFIGSVFNLDTSINSYFDGVFNIATKKTGHLKFLAKLFLFFANFKVPPGSIVHVQRADLCLPFIIFSRKTKIICTSHGNQGRAVAIKRGRIQGVIFRLLENIAIAGVNSFIVVDKKNEMYFKRKYPRFSLKIIRIPIGIDFNRFYPMNKGLCRKKYGFPAESEIILYIGRLEAEKNLRLLLDAYKMITRKVSQYFLIIVGSGSMENELKEYTSKTGIENVLFMGELPYGEIPDIINCGDVLILTSLFEGSPTVIKEALACNVPVISTDCGDVEDVINDFENCYIADFDSHDLAMKITLSLSDKNCYDYRQRLLKYSNENLFNQLFSIYSS